jgi:RNA polymerase sigma factor (sigma-70 family)
LFRGDGMANDHEFLRQIDRLFQDGTITGLDEGQLLERFATGRDESALAALVERHGPMVLGVCRRLLANPRDVEDAFQATFLILVRKARALRDRHRLGPWLHGVAHRVASRARADTARRRVLEQRGARAEFEATVHAPDRLAAQAELSAVVDEEIARLSAAHRAAVVLCDLEGQTQHEAARVLGWSEGALRGRLARARQKLRDRLLRRGVAPSCLAAGTSWPHDGFVPSVPSSLLETTTRAATATLLAGRASPSAATAISASVTALVQGVIRAMTVSKMTALAGAVVLAALSLLMLGGLVQGGLSALADNHPQLESPKAQAAAIREKAGVRTLDFRAVRRSDKQPISGVTVEFSYYLDQSQHETKHTTDGQGRCTIELPQGLSSFAVSCGKDGFVPTQQAWGDQEIQAGLPATYTQEFEPGLPIGSFVIWSKSRTSWPSTIPSARTIVS